MADVAQSWEPIQKPSNTRGTMMKSSIFLVGILVDLCPNPRIPLTTLFYGITLTFGMSICWI